MRVEGQLIFNMTDQMLSAALAGFGMAYIPENLAEPHLAKGRLKGVLKVCCAPLRDTTSITRADASRDRPLHCWSIRCDTGVDAATQGP